MDSVTVGWILVVAGLVLALVGRHVFWLAVGIVGFLVTSSLVAALLPDVDPLVQTVLAGVVGVAGAIVTLMSLRVVAAIAGALLLGIVGRAMFVLYVSDTAWQWLAFALGAVLGWMLVRGLFDIGIIVTTALGGGWYVAVGLGATDVDLAAETTVWIGLGVALVGVAVQTGLWRRSVSAARRRTPSPSA
jgi:hypothetical protein